jgi:hypothetical protein
MLNWEKFNNFCEYSRKNKVSLEKNDFIYLLDIFCFREITKMS